MLVDGKQSSTLQLAAMGSSAQLWCWWLAEAESDRCVHGQMLVKAQRFDGDRVVGKCHQRRHVLGGRGKGEEKSSLARVACSLLLLV